MAKTCFVLFILCLYSFNLLAQNEQQKEYTIFYHPNGKISSEGYMVNGQPEGLWKSYYVTGVIKSEGRRYKHKLDSIWVFYDHFGDTIEKISYKYGIKNGYHITYQRDDKIGQNILKSKELYINNRREGKAYYYFDDGKIYRLSYFNEGKLDGYEYIFSEDGRIVTVNSYLKGNMINRDRINRYDEQNRKDGIWREYYADYKIKSETVYDHGTRNGLYKDFSKSGKLIFSALYKNNEIIENNENAENKVEIRKQFSKDSVLVASGAFIEDIQVGIHRKFDSEGNVIDSKTYSNEGILKAKGIVTIEGLRMGEWINYYDNGGIHSKGDYEQGRRNGLWMFYYESAKLEQKGTFRYGEPDGSWTWYFENGEIRKEENYYNGKEDGETFEFDESGQIIAKGNYIEGERDGKWYLNIGDIVEEGKFINGLKDGVWTSEYQDETLRFKGRFIQGNPDGKHLYYYPNGNIEEERFYNQGFKDKTWKKFDNQGNMILTVTYENDKEIKINGIKIELPEPNIKRIE